MPPPSSPTSAASVQVVVRLRPLNDREKTQNTLPVVACNTQEKSVTVLKGSGKHQTKTQYNFDNVFGSFSTQAEVFEETLQPILHDVLLGYESTVFAYGQTGTGKTHTMEGSLEVPDSYGVIPRAAQALFDRLQKDSSYISHKVYCSFLEIYNEELCDLLIESNGNKPKLQIMEGKNGPFCRGLSETAVGSAQELLGIMRNSQQRRQTGETNMNAQSSRSHCIFTLRVEATRQLPDQSTLAIGGKLHCVDLAGSENAAKANLGGGDGKQAARELERKNINQSLLTLGRVVSALKELSQNPKKKSSVRIPYRDSKLTRILQESLGGRCKTCVIATISPSIMAIEETISTLNYAQQANGIINKPVTTSSMMVGSTMATVISANDNGDGGAGSVEHWHEMEVRLQYMQSQVDEAQQALARKHIQHQEIAERAEKAEQDRKVAEAKYQEALEQVGVLETTVEETTSKLKETETELTRTKVVLEATRETEAALTKEATALLQALQETIADGETMHQALVKRHEGETKYKSGTKSYQAAALQTFQDTTNLLSEINELHSNHHSAFSESHSKHYNLQLEYMENHKTVIESLKATCVDWCHKLRGNMQNDLIPSLHRFTTKLKKQVENVASAIDNSNQSLQSSCAAITQKLDQLESQFCDFGRAHSEEANLLKHIVKENVDESKENLAKVLTTFVKSMEDAASARSDTRNSIREGIDKWNETSLTSMNKMQALSFDHGTVLKGIISALEDESVCRNEIYSLVKQQADILLQSKNILIRQLQSQNADLQKQNEELKTVQTEQKQHNQMMAKNVLVGMQALLEKEMAGMSKFQNETFGSFRAKTEETLNMNKRIVLSVDNSINELMATNDRIHTKLSSNFAAQESVGKSLGSSADSFSALIEKQLQTAKSNVDECATNVNDNLACFEEIDLSASKSLSDDMCSKFNVHFVNAFGAIQSKVSNRLDVLETHVATIGEQIKQENLVQVRSHLSNDLLSYQRGIATGIKSSLKNIESLVSDEEGGLVTSANKSVNVATNLQNTMLDCTAQFEKSTDAQKAAVNENKASLDKALHECCKDIAGKISKAKTKIGSSIDQLDWFVSNVIRCDESPEGVAERPIPAYSTSLSSTPDASVLLKDSGAQAIKETTIWKDESKPKKVLKDRAVNVNEEAALPLSSTAKRPADMSAYSSRLGKRSKG